MKRIEQARLAIVKSAIEGRRTNSEAAELLGLSKRRVQAIKKAIRERGDAAIIHGNSGRSPVNATPEKTKAKIIALKKTKLYDAVNFTYFQELLKENEGIEIGYRTLHDLLNKAGIVSCKKHRTEGRRFRRREARQRAGDLLQTDATSFDWFKTGERLALHVFLDDATGKIVGLYFCENECLQGYFEAFRSVLLHYGIPNEIYADRSSNFFVNTKKPQNWTIEEQLAGKVLDKTQFGRVAERLGVTLIPAGSPQAKGKVERLWDTLQGRLPTWLSMNAISTMEAANKAAPLIMSMFNRRFGHDSADTNRSEFSALPCDIDLDTLLCVKNERKTDNCGCFSYHRLTFQIVSKKAIAKKQIVFMFSEKIGFKALYQNTVYPVKLINMDSNTLPIVTERLLHSAFFSNLKDPSLPRGGGDVFSG